MLVGTRLRHEELYGLEWRDVDLKAGVLNVEVGVHAGPVEAVHDIGPSAAPRTLRDRVIEALEQMPRGFGETPVFTTKDGDRRHATFRLRYWTLALAAAELDHRGVCATRHAFAVWSIRAGVQLFLSEPDHGGVHAVCSSQVDLPTALGASGRLDKVRLTADDGRPSVVGSAAPATSGSEGGLATRGESLRANTAAELRLESAKAVRRPTQQPHSEIGGGLSWGEGRPTRRRMPQPECPPAAATGMLANWRTVRAQ